MKIIRVPKKKEMRYRRISEEIINFLRMEFKKRNKTKAIVGISGGIDSAVTSSLCKKAGLDLYVTNLAYKKRGLTEAKKVIEYLDLPKSKISYIDITPLVDLQIRKIQKIIKLDKISIGNIFPRQRMIIQYALASRLNALVVGTQNLSEYCLGYFTTYGDQAFDTCPIAGLWKSQVYQLAKYLKIPEIIVEREPSGDLWPRLTDEKDLGFNYEYADEIMHLLFVRRYTKREIVARYGFNSKLVDKVSNRIKITDYKRRDIPKCYFI